MPYTYMTKLEAGQNIVQAVNPAMGIMPTESPPIAGYDLYWHDSAYAAPGSPVPAGSVRMPLKALFASVRGELWHLKDRKGTAPIKYHLSVYNSGTNRQVRHVYYSAGHNSGRDCSESVEWMGGCNELYELVTTGEPPALYSTGVPAGATLIRSL